MKLIILILLTVGIWSLSRGAGGLLNRRANSWNNWPVFDVDIVTTTGV